MKDMVEEARRDRALRAIASVYNDVEANGARSLLILRVDGNDVELTWTELEELQVIGALEQAKNNLMLATNKTSRLVDV